MQQTYKHSFTDSKMQKDLDSRLVSPREYRDAVNVAVSRSEGADVGALENILGNEFVSNLQYPSAGLDTRFFVIGWYIDENNDKIYTFVTDYKDNSSTKLENTAGPLTYHSIVETDIILGTSQVLVTGSFLNFSANSPINHVDQIENLLFWTDNRNQPRTINITTARSSITNYVKESDVAVARYYPYDPIKLKREYTLTNCVYTSKTEYLGLSPGYDAWYNYFILEDNPSQTVISEFTDNIGCKGYVEDANGDRFEFRLAWFQQDGYNPDDTTTLDNDFLPPPFDSADNTPGNPNRKYLLFIDRELDTTNFPLWNGTTNPVPAGNKFTVTLIQENNKDISNPWKEEDQFKMVAYNEVNAASDVVRLLPNLDTASTSNFTFHSLIPSMFYFGTRSCPNGSINSGFSSVYTAWLAPAGTGLSSSVYPVNRIENTFPTNTTAAGVFPTGVDGKNAYLRITHPKIPKEQYVVMTNLLTAPTIPLTSPPPLLGWFGKYTDLRNGELQYSDIYSDFGITDGDILSFHLPNKYYNQDFPGDPAFLEDKFVRFAYRYRFNDGEYSLLSPFTQSVFVPKQGGYFQKTIGTNKQKATNNDIINQEQEAGENTIVSFLVNEITEIALDIPLPSAANKLKSIFKVDEIEIVYKESTALALKVVEKLSLEDYTTDGNDFITYKYQSRRPIKALPDSVIQRVYDKIPIKAAAQASAGNRIIYANFLDAHTSPLTLDYLVGVSAKFTPAFKQYTGSDVAYPNHTLKQNRTYQVGIVLQDKYGRSSDVVLSSVRDDNYQENSGPFAQNPVVFGGSTVYSEYFDNVLNPSANASSMQNPRAGLVDWPGNSLKILFANPIPNVINTNNGYPGLYSNLLSVLSFTGLSGSPEPGTTGLIAMTFNGSIGDISLAKVGDYITWTQTNGVLGGGSIDINYEFEIALVKNSGVLYVKDNLDYPFPGVPPVGGTKMDLMERNENGFYSYKIVVKQTEQDYYNVYLPSLLNGNPIIKPFKLEVSGLLGTGTVIDGTPAAADPKTFLLLEGMNFTVGSTEYTVTNIVTNDQFTYSPPTTFAATTNVVFTTKSSKNIVNVTTLLTDNANKVPPGLLETTPVQQQYSPSDTTLYPRVAIQEGYTATNQYYTGVASQNIPIFPGRRDMKVRAVGNFFALNTDANTAGLFEAKSDPPAANIENSFRLGRDAETVLPDSVEPLVFSAYETNPTKSAIEIFWETGTSGLITDLNKEILDDPLVAFRLVALSSEKYNESLDRTGSVASRRIFQFTIQNINDVIIPISSITSFTLSNLTNDDGSVQYTTNAPITIESPASEPTLPANTFSLNLSNNSNLYSSGVEINNYIRGDVRLEISNPLQNFYNFPFRIQIINSAPVYQYGEQDTALVVGISNNSGITETGIPSSIAGSWSRADTTGTCGASNGTNTNNGIAHYQEIVFKLEFEKNPGEWAEISENYNGLTLVDFENTNFPGYGTNSAGKVLTVGDVTLVSNGAQSWVAETPIRIRAIDQAGLGVSTLISQYNLTINY